MTTRTATSVSRTDFCKLRDLTGQCHKTAVAAQRVVVESAGYCHFDNLFLGQELLQRDGSLRHAGFRRPPHAGLQRPHLAVGTYRGDVKTRGSATSGAGMVHPNRPRRPNLVTDRTVSGRGDSQLGQTADDETLVLQGCATGCDDLPESQVGDEGLELSYQTEGKSDISVSRAAQLDTLTDLFYQLTPEEQAEFLQKGILSAIRASDRG